MQTWHIHINGRVQGVGFRPFVYRLAKHFGLTGTVANTPDGVHIYVNANAEDCNAFMDAIVETKPTAASIVAISKQQASAQQFDAFKIVESGNHTQPKLLITPDIGLCDECRNELHNKKDRRHNYAFTTCTQCGPRYSIMNALPYDRATTTMKPFVMCPTCKKEYNAVTNRRFYSQTNSCPTCGINLYWLTKEPENIDPIKHTVDLLEEGKIVAVKGIGGFLLLVDATNDAAIMRLRVLKKRPGKPFALLFHSVEQASQYTRITPIEQKALTSTESPIVLLRMQRETLDLSVDAIAPGLNRLGVMLPYAPILELIAFNFGKPLVATSANVSGSPIVYKDVEAVRILEGVADAILSNDREIHFPQDDSVRIYSPVHRNPVILRRSRGLAPSINWPDNRLQNNYLAFGAEMKSAFALTSQGNTYLSQYLGDTAAYESQQAYNTAFLNMLNLVKPEVKHVVVDAHPDYHTSNIGRSWASYHGSKVSSVQHHQAHFASILAESNLIEQTEPVLGVIWDGTGYGSDGMIWGSEFFMYCKHKMQRINHLMPYPQLFNNRMAKQPSIATMAAMHPLNPGKVWQRNHFSDAETDIIAAKLMHPDLYTTSMGRLFDAVAGLLELTMENTFEGESAMALQTVAEKSERTTWDAYCLPIENNRFSTSLLLEKIHTEKKLGISVEDLALRFHQTLVNWIAWIADTQQVKKVAFSGGVFQNTLLVDLIIDRLGDYHELYFHKLLSPNDENIAIGQIAMANISTLEEEKKESLISNKEKICV